MDSIALLRNRIGAVNAALHDLVGQVDGVDLVEPVIAGTSPVGLTLWHMPRAQDWLVHTTIRAVPEVADSFPPDGLPDPEEYGFGTGLTPERARAAAAEVSPEALLAYADAVTADIDGWLETLGSTTSTRCPTCSAASRPGPRTRRKRRSPTSRTSPASPPVSSSSGPQPRTSSCTRARWICSCTRRSSAEAPRPAGCVPQGPRPIIGRTCPNSLPAR